MANCLPKVGRLGRRPKNPTKGSRRGEGSPQVGVAVAARGAAAGRGPVVGRAVHWSGRSASSQLSQLNRPGSGRPSGRPSSQLAAGRFAWHWPLWLLLLMQRLVRPVACQGSGLQGHFALAGWFLGWQADKTPSCNLPPPHQIPARLPKPLLPARPAASCR